MNLIERKLLLPVAIALAVAACGGGGGGDDNSSGGSSPPPAATTKTRIVTGAIDGFGSVIVNGVRYDTSATQVRIEDRPGTMSELAVGQVVRIEAEVDDRGGARAKTLEQHRLIQGTVQGVDAAAGTLTIAGQVVRVDDDTSFDDSIAQGSLAGIAVGDRIEVHGFSGATGQARATRIEKAGASEIEVEVTGRVTALDTVARRFRIGTLVVDYSSATLEDFGATGLRDGDLVEVKGREYTADGALRAHEVDKEDGGVDGQSGNEAEVEGFVTRFVSAADFDVAGQKVTTNSGTTYSGGTAADLRADVKVEVEGRLDTAGVLVATKVVFKRNGMLKLAAPVEAIDSAAGTLRALGLTIVVDASTRKEDHEDDDPIFGLDDLRVGDWIEVRGYPDPAGTGRVIATRLERDDPEDEVELRGPASELQAPRLRIFGVNVETTPATEFEDEDVRIDAATFFARANGTVVEAEGSWNGTTLVARKAEIEREDGATAAPPPSTTPPPPTTPPTTPPPPPPPSGLDGAALYAANCAGCHGPITAIRLMPVSNRNVTDIQRAITDNKGGMGFLSTLTAQQLQAIVDAMRAANP